MRSFAMIGGVLLLAWNSTAIAQKKAGMRQKVITQEKSFQVKKGQDSQSLDFDSTDIGGERKSPLGSLINQSKSDKNFDFIKIRLRWHPEMISSTSELDSGGG